MGLLRVERNKTQITEKKKNFPSDKVGQFVP